MFAKVNTLSLIGLEAKKVAVEADISPGLFSFNIVGLAGKSVQEAKNRVCSAIINSGYELPMRRITVNLSPADLVKNSSSFDLPIAVAIILATEQAFVDFSEAILWGELSLEGELLPTKGALAIADTVYKEKYKNLILPFKNAREAEIVEGISLYPVSKLSEVLRYPEIRKHERIVDKYVYKDAEIGAGIQENDFAYLKGQKVLKRVAEIAVAGGHNLLLNGVPGSGKTFVSRCLTTILPSMQYHEKVEVTKIYSVSGLLGEDGLVNNRPFRAPHHTSSHAALIGGGSIPKPGEVTLAHRGILFLDEFSEFEARALESLRQPLEDKKVHISRASGVMIFPADFMLVAAMNPCRCGFLGDDDPKTECKCSEYDLERYRNKLSGPILDRIDLQVYVHKVAPKDLLNNELSEPSWKIRKRVEKAREFQLSRLKNQAIINCYSNSDLNNHQLKRIVNLDESAKKLTARLLESLNISARGYYKLLKVSRTIADLEQREKVTDEDIAEAAGYRVS